MRVVRVLVVLVVVGSVLAPSSGVGSDRVLAQTEESAGGLCDVGGVEQFSDVGVGVYGAEYVLCMRALGLSVGRGDGGFGPGLELTRGQMASFLVRLWRDVLGRECPDDVGVPFEDVAGSVHEANIVCLFGLEVTKGTTAVTYGPSEKLKASQIARFLLRTFEKTGGSCDGPGDELERALECLLRLGVIPSKAEAAGSGPVTRAQMAVYVIGLWHNIAGDGAAPTPPGKPSGGRDEDDDGRVTVPVRAERVELAHISEGDVRVALGLEEPVSVGGALSGTADATGLAVAVDGEGRPQGLSLVVKGDTAVDVHVDYKTTAAALVLLTPGLATTDPMITLGLVVLLAELAELEALANQLEVDAARYGPDYLVDLSSQAQQALSAAVVALVAAVGDLAAGGLAVDLSGFGPPGGTVGGRVVAGLGLVADDELSPAGQAGWGGSVAIANECEPAWNEEDGTFGVWDPSPTLIGGDDRICLEGPISSLSGENDSWWSALLVPVTVMDGGVVRFFEGGEMYISSKTADFPDIFGEVIWGVAKRVLCGQVSSVLNSVEQVSLGLFKNPLRCGTWSSYVEVFRLNSGGIVENADLRPLYDSDDPVKRLAVVKSNMAGPNRYEKLPVDNPERLAALQRTGTIYQAVHLLTPVLGIALDAAMGKVTKELKPILGDFLETSGKRFVTANTDQVADFSATLARIVAATLVNTTEDERIEDLTQQGNRYSPEEKEHSLRQITSILLPIVEVVLLGAVKKVAAAAIPVVGQVITALEVLDTGIGVVNTAGTWTQAILQHGYPTLNFYAQGKPPPPGPSPTASPSLLAAGTHHSCWIRADNTIGCIGDSDDGQTVVPDDGPFTSVAAGHAHTCALRDSGAIACWGSNLRGQYVPKPQNAGPFIALTAGRYFTCGLHKDRSIECWGENDSQEPITVEPDNGPYTAISAGSYHACALDTNGNIECWGNNEHGEANNRNDGPYTAVAAGHTHTCALREDRTATCWGNPDDGRTTPPQAGEAVGYEYVAITAGRQHTCARQQSGTVHCWGNNEHGQTDVPDIDSPNEHFTAIDAGDTHTCGRLNTGNTHCWGNYRKSRPHRHNRPNRYNRNRTTPC